MLFQIPVRIGTSTLSALSQLLMGHSRSSINWQGTDLIFFLNLLQLHRAEQQNAKANCKLRKTPVHWLLSWNQQSSFPNIGWVKGTVIIIILQKLTALNRKRWQLHWSSSKLPAKCKEEHNLSRTWICKRSRTRALLQTGVLSKELHFNATEIHFPPTNSLFNLIHRILLVAVCL